MAGILDFLRGEGEFSRVEERRFDLYSGRVRRIPKSFLDFSLNRDIPNWPWPDPSPWERISLPPNTGDPGSQERGMGGLSIRETWAFDWIHPGPSFTSPGCGAPATGEYALTYGEGIELALEFPDLREFRVTGSYSEIEQRTTNVTMDSGNVQDPAPGYEYQVKPLIEVLYFKRIENYYSPSGLRQFFFTGIFPYSFGYERTLYVEGMSYAVARRPCAEMEEDGQLDEEG